MSTETAWAKDLVGRLERTRCPGSGIFTHHQSLQRVFSDLEEAHMNGISRLLLVTYALADHCDAPPTLRQELLGAERQLGLALSPLSPREL